MHIFKHQLFKALLAPVIALGLAAGCQTYNPATGQQQIDYGATAGVAGAAMGAAALGVALSNNNNHRYNGGPVVVAGGRGGHGVDAVVTMSTSTEASTSVAIPSTEIIEPPEMSQVEETISVQGVMLRVAVPELVAVGVAETACRFAVGILVTPLCG